MKTHVWITTQFPGCHAWPDAPEATYWLRSPHRHLFHVKVTVDVSHPDRDVEFFHLKHEVECLIEGAYNLCTKDIHGPHYRELSSRSCEMIAYEIAVILNLHYVVVSVEVSEDGENGAIYYVESLGN